MSEVALRQRRRNLRGTRLRSDRESLIIKLLIWQSFFGPEPQPSQRTLARELGVWPSYIHKVLSKARTEGLDALLQHGRVTLANLADAHRFTAKLHEQEPSLLAPSRRLDEGELPASDGPRAYAADEIIAERRCEVAEWKRNNLRRYDTRRRISVPIPY